MTKYVGYYTEQALPFRQGEMVVIPAGTTVKSINPSRKSYVTKRKQTIKVHHLMNGRSIYVHMMSERDRNAYPQFANLYSEFDALRVMMRELDGDEYRLALSWFDAMKIDIDNPSVCWPGAGGYWCEAQINDLLAANDASAALVSLLPKAA